jgi:hypothetical protein
MPSRRTAVEVCPHCDRKIRPTGDEIKAIRELASLSCAAFGAKLGISPSHVVLPKYRKRLMGADLVPRHYSFARKLVADAQKKLASATERVAGV